MVKFDTNSILSVLNVVIQYKQMHCMHVCMDVHEHSYSYTCTASLAYWLRRLPRKRKIPG